MSYAAGAKGIIARIVERNGQLVLEDPQAEAVFGAIERLNFFQLQPKADMLRLLDRAAVKSIGLEPHCVIVIDVDHGNWRWLVDMLMPGYNWDAHRKRGETPVARGAVPVDLIRRPIETLSGALPAEAFVAVFGVGGISVLLGADALRWLT